MAEFTKEQRDILIKTAEYMVKRENTSEYSENIRKVAEIALVALTEQPVGFYRASRHGDGYYLANNMEQTLGTIPLYRLPLLEGLK